MALKGQRSHERSSVLFCRWLGVMMRHAFQFHGLVAKVSLCEVVEGLLAVDSARIVWGGRGWRLWFMCV